MNMSTAQGFTMIAPDAPGAHDEDKWRGIFGRAARDPEAPAPCQTPCPRRVRPKLAFKLQKSVRPFFALE